jgi:hypothetical protein
MGAETIAKNLQTHLGKDAVLRMVINVGILLTGIFSMAADENLKAQSLPYLAFLARGYFSLELMIYIANISQLLARNFIKARLIVRFTDDFPAIYNFWKYVSSQFWVRKKKQPQKKVCY